MRGEPGAAERRTHNTLYMEYACQGYHASLKRSIFGNFLNAGPVKRPSRGLFSGDHHGIPSRFLVGLQL